MISKLFYTAVVLLVLGFIALYMAVFHDFWNSGAYEQWISPTVFLLITGNALNLIAFILGTIQIFKGNAIKPWWVSSFLLVVLLIVYLLNIKY